MPAYKGAPYTFETTLISLATGELVVEPTLEPGDVLLSKDGGAFAPLETTPTTVAGSELVTVQLSAAETAADRLAIRFQDVAGNQWKLLIVTLNTEIKSDVVGPGSVSYPVEVCDSENNPVGEAACWVTTDMAGTNTIAGTLCTNSLGKLDTPFMLDPGTYYLWFQKSGVNFDPNPTLIEVTSG